MKVCILKNHSSENERVYQLSLKNHAEYAAVHGYDIISLNMPYKQAMWDVLDDVEWAMRKYDAVLTVGSDVLFTRMGTSVRDICQGHPDKDVLISLEDIGGSPVNADVIIWRSSPFGFDILNTVRGLRSLYETHPWGAQQAFNHLWNKWEKAPLPIAFLPPRELQSCPVWSYPQSMWRPGDFALHFLGMSNEDKETRIKHFFATCEVMWRD